MSGKDEVKEILVKILKIALIVFMTTTTYQDKLYYQIVNL